jgi:hypothetical protein
LRHVYVRKAVSFAFSFLFQNAAALAGRTAVPLLAGAATYYVTFDLYLIELARYLEQPNDRVASVVLGLATAGALLLVFLHSVVVSSVTSLAMGLEGQRWKYFRAGRPEWRLYAANLRYLVVFLVMVSAIRGPTAIAVQFVPSIPLEWIADVVLALAIMWLTVRIWFLVAPVAAAESGPVLRRAWTLSAHDIPAIAVVLLVLGLPGAAAEFVTEFVFRATGTFPSLEHVTRFAHLVVVYRQVLPEILTAVGLGYVVAIVPMTLAKVSVYRQLTDEA